MEHNYTLKRKRGRPSKNPKGNASSFFKIILQPTLEEKKMRIPYRFVGKSGSKLVQYSFVDLVDPCSRSWRVKLTKDGDDFWFDGGRWNDLVDFYSISYGHFLLFQYDGKSTFHFQIFDTSTCDIDYESCETKASSSNTSTHVQNMMAHKPENAKVDGTKNKQIDFHEDEDEDDEEDDDDDDEIKVQKTIKEPNRENIDVINLAAEEEDDYAINFLHHNRLRVPIKPTDDAPEQRPFIESYVSKRFVSDVTYSAGERMRAVRAVENIKPRDPNFLVIIKNIKSRNELYVPLEFTRRHLSKFSRRTVKIVDDHGGSWSVWMTRVANGGFKMSSADFDRNLNLKIGNICIFELNKVEADYVFKVSTFRAT